MTASAGPLHGVRVLDLADESGAYCGRLLAAAGANVIKIEPPGGDPTRDLGPFFAGRRDREGSLFFWFYNSHKRSVVLDLQQPEGRARLAELAATTDIVIESGPRGRLSGLGLGYERLAAANPGVILVSISPFGQDGPYRDWRSSDTVAQALGGMLFVNGHPDQPPLRALGLQAYHSAATYGAIGALLALLARRRSGRGQHIDVSLQECVAATVEHVSSSFHHTGQIEVRRGTLHWTRAFRVARCRDGYIMHCSLGDWTTLVEWVKADGKAQELAGAEWEDYKYRREHCERLFDILDQWARDYTVAELMEGAQLRRLPYAAVLPPETLAENPQLAARSFFVSVDHPELNRTLLYPGPPFRLDGDAPARRPPLLAEHTAEVLAELRSPTLPLARGFPLPPGEGQGEGKIAATLLAEPHLSPLPEGEGARKREEGEFAGSRALDGIRVIDFTWVVAGPVATRILADHGAEVIKIERRDSLDFGSRRGGLTGNLNRGKQSIVLNMAEPRGIELARRLVATADVVIDNFSARVMRNWGFDYESLTRIRPDIIAASMSGFGHSGPHKDYVSYGPTLQALSGYTLLMRHPGSEPAGWGFSYSDMAGGYNAALAVLLALWQRQHTGRGQFIDLSQFESVTALLGPLLLDVLANGGTVAPSGNRSPERPAAPHGVYRCRDDESAGPAGDRWCAIGVFGDGDWRSFCNALGNPAWAHEARFVSLAARLKNQDALDDRVTAWTRQRSAEEVMHILQRAGIAAGVVNNARDLCERDAQLRARGYWAALTTPEGERFAFDGVPVKLSGTPGRIAAPGPLLGEHTDSVLERLLGLSPAAIAGLREEQVIA